LPADVPPAIRTLIQRCLAKDRRQRIADISIAQYVLTESASLASAVAPASVVAPPRPLWRRAMPFATTALVSVFAATAVWLAMRPAAPSPADPVRFTIAPPADLRLWTPPLGSRDVAISPDGRHVVYTTGNNPGNAQLLIRPIDQLESTPLRGLTGTSWPFVSPDSRSIGFFRLSRSGSELQKVSMTGGPAVMVARIQGILAGASWGPDDTIVFATNTRATGLLRVPAGGGEPMVLTTPDAGHGELHHYWPSFLPGGRAVLFTIVPQGGLENMQVAVLDLRNGQRKTLIRGASQAAYVETGHLVYASAGTLRGVRFDPVRLEVSGDPVPVVEQVLTKPNGTAEFSVSRTGSLVYVTGTASETTHLTWVDRAGRPTGTVSPPGPYRNPTLSPDGTRVAVERTDPQSRTQAIWLIELARGVASRFTFDAHNDIYAVWSPDGSRIAFGSDRDDGVFSVYEKPANGATSEVLLLKTAEGAAPYSWAPEGRCSSIAPRKAGHRGSGCCLAQARGNRICSNRRPSPKGSLRCHRPADGSRTARLSRAEARSTCGAFRRRAVSTRFRKTAEIGPVGVRMERSCSSIASTGSSRRYRWRARPRWTSARLSRSSARRFCEEAAAAFGNSTT
jgi:serine/threonine-protein kinase